jgi:TRAP-type C4-dicarboxylate transport system substrate-binding protein
MRKPHALVAVVGAVAALAAPAPIAQTTARLSYHWAPTHESAIMSKRLADEVTKRSGGKLKIDVFPSGQLYTIRQIIGALSAGSVEMGGVVTHNQIAAIDRDWNVFQLPYFWESIEQQRRFLAESSAGRALRERVLQRTGRFECRLVTLPLEQACDSPTGRTKMAIARSRTRIVAHLWRMCTHEHSFGGY